MNKGENRRVWYISKYFMLPSKGTVGTRGFFLMRALAARGNPVTVFTSTANHLTTPPTLDGPYQVDEVEGIQVIWIRTLGYAAVRSMRRVLSWLHFEWGLLRVSRKTSPAPAVVVASSLSLTSVLTGLLLSRRHKARFVFEVRDIWPLTLTEEANISPRHPLVRLMAWVERLGYERAHAVVGTMPNLEAHVRQVSRSVAPVHCIPMGYDDSCVGGDEGVRGDEVVLPQAYVDAAIPAGKFLVGYAGSVGTSNALGTLFDCAELLREDTSIHFVIVGSGDLLEEYIRRYEHLPNLTFVGRVPHESVRAVLQIFDVLYFSTHPSKVWEYGQSLNKVIDYMSAAKPVVASYSGFPSMLDESGSGIFVPAGDAEALVRTFVELAAKDRAKLREMGLQGREWLLKHRGYAALAEEYEKILFPSADENAKGNEV